MKTKVTKITIEVGNQVIKLTPEEARALRDELNNVIGETKYLPSLPSYPSRRRPPYKIGDTPPFTYTIDGTSNSQPLASKGAA